MVHRISVSLLTLFCVSAAAGSTQEDRQKAATLWDQAVAAKGGRDRLAGIRSFAILKKTRFRGLMTRDVARGKVDQIVCELPDQWWEFLDYRPGLMGYFVDVLNTRSGVGWMSNSGTVRPAPGRSAYAAEGMRQHTAYRMRQLQYVYFLETKSVQPNPLRAARVHLGFRPVDRVETDLEGELVVFYLDVNTHLPVRIQTVHNAGVLREPRPGAFRGRTVTSERRYTYDLDGYHDVAGIQVPARVALGGDPSEAMVEINPDYDPSIFTTPLPPDTRIDSWRKRVPPTR
jgi:hypothetical protein